MRYMLALLILTLTLMTLTHATPTPTTSTPTSIAGRYVILSGDNSQVCLSVAEIEVYDMNRVNVARNASVWQSDFWDDSSFPASNLVDGNVNTIAHTSCRPGAQSGVPIFGGLILPNTTTPVAAAQFAWMAMDLGADFNITSIVVQNRLDPCCTFRLGQGVHVLIFNSQQSVSPAFVSNTLTANLTQAMAVPSPTMNPTQTPSFFPTQVSTSYPTQSYPTPTINNPTQTPTSFPSTSYPTPAYYSSTGSAWFPTSTPSSSQRDHGTYWPWSTPTGSLPAAVNSPYLNPIVDDGLNHIIWQTDANVSLNIMGPIISYGGILQYSGTTSQHSYYYATFTDYYNAQGFFNSMPSITRIWISGGYTQRQSIMTSATLLMLRYSYLWTSYRIPSPSVAAWAANTYYVAARSTMGEFRMITFSDVTQAMNAYQEVVTETVTGTREKQWSTVKLYGVGYTYAGLSLCWGSELEHLGAFQWLEFDQRAFRRDTFGNYNMVVSWRALSGVRLERMQTYSQDYQSALDAKAWAVWYSTNYEPYYDQATVVIYNDRKVISATVSNAMYYQQLYQDYYWVSDYIGQTYYPTSYPIIDQRSTSWNDLKTNQKAFIIAYPTALVAAAVIILVISGCCLKRRRTPTPNSAFTSTSVSTTCHRMTCVVVMLSLASLAMLITSIGMKRFSNVEIKYDTTVVQVWAMYGPFQVVQNTPYLAWLPVLWNARVMSPIAGVAMIVSMSASTATMVTIAIAKKRGCSPARALFISIVAFISSLLAVLLWIPVHVRNADHDNDYTVLRPFWGPNYNFHYRLYRYVGTSYILLCVATAIQLVNVICMAIMHKKSIKLSLAAKSAAPQQQHSNDGLQLVQHTSQYYYRDVPAPAPAAAAPVLASAPTYIYGVPASAPPPPFAFIQAPSQGYVYAAPMYHPAGAEPSHQTIIAAAAYPAPAATQAPAAAAVLAPGPASAGYPSLPVAVPLAGPTTAYSRLL